MLIKQRIDKVFFETLFTKRRLVVLFGFKVVVLVVMHSFLVTIVILLLLSLLTALAFPGPLSRLPLMQMGVLELCESEFPLAFFVSGK